MDATCKFCNAVLTVMTWDSKPRFPQHKTEPGSIYACEGSGELVEIASDDYQGPTRIDHMGKIPGRRGSSVGEKIARKARREAKKTRSVVTVPSWHDKQEYDEWADKIPF